MPDRRPFRVDSLPSLWKPVWFACSWVLGVAAFALLHVLHLTCRLHIEGLEPVEARGGYIYTFWHQAWCLWMVAFVRSQGGHAWLQHPAAYMKPIHIVVRLMGVRVVLGSSGHEGRRATAGLVDLLKQGRSTAISPDGPHGPPNTLKKGVLYLALQSGVPIVPVRCDARPAFRLRSWDRKIVPFPFARIRIRFGVPMTVREENFLEVERVLAARITDE